MLHAAFVRSPFAHARIVSIDTGEARRQPGVALVMTGAELAKLCTAPWVGTLTCFPGMKSAPQYPHGRRPGVLGRRAGGAWSWRARAPRPRTPPSACRSSGRSCRPSPTRRPRSMPGTPPIHAELGDNLAFRKTIDTGDVEAAFAKADLVIEDTFEFGRHTAVSLESRAVLAAYDKGTGKLTITTSSQCPHMIQRVFAHTLGVPDHMVQIIAPDVGGSFGLKIHTYGDELATAAAAIQLGRPVKFIADRLESFVSDIHARENFVKARIAVEQVGRDPGLRRRRAVGCRRLLAVSAHQRARGHAGAQHHGRALPAQALPRRAPPWSISTSRRPRSTAPSAIRSATRWASTWSTAPPRRWGSTPSRCAAATSCPTTAIPPSRASGIKLKDLSHQRCIDVLVERMRYPELRAGAGAAAREGHPSRHRHRLLHQGHRAGAARLLRHRRRADLAAGCLRHPARAQRRRALLGRRDRAGPGHRHRHGPDRRRGAGRADRERAGDLRRHRRHALRRRHLRLAGGRPSAARPSTWRPATCARRSSRSPACCCRPTPAALDIVDGVVVDRAGGAKRLPLSEIGRIGHFQLAELPRGVQPAAVAHAPLPSG